VVSFCAGFLALSYSRNSGASSSEIGFDNNRNAGVETEISV
jgi:hypothetical protein